MGFKAFKNRDRKGTIIFIHGNSSSSRVFDTVMTSDDIPYSKIAVDLPGHGENQENYDKIEDFTLSRFIDKCVDFINTIDNEILLVGNSLGGHLIIEAAQKINNLKGVVIFGTPPVKYPINLDEIYLPNKELQIYFTETPSLEDIYKMSKIAVFEDKYADLIVSDFQKTNPLVRAAIASSLGDLTDEYEIFKNLQVPRYIIAGRQDPSVNLEYLKEVQKCCNGKCELIMFEKCGHYPSLEKPEEFISVIQNISSEVFTSS
ncbi:alpha/beta hydrolase [Flavobacteriaceae bacterium GSB9]|nr:alpha/beta hydrolase [Flavobacteriaceae bacterium GSB9]